MHTRLTRRQFSLATGLALAVALTAPSLSRADLRISLSENGTNYTVVATSQSTFGTPNSAIFSGSFGAFSLTLDTTASNYPPGNSQFVNLKTTTNTTLTGSGTHTLYVLAEIVEPTVDDKTSPLAQIPVPSSTPGVVLNTQFTTTGVDTDTFTTLFNGTAYGPYLPQIPPPGTDTVIPNPTIPYTLANLTTITLTGTGAPGGVTGGTTGQSTINATPEPGTIAMALSALPLLGLAYRRRRRS